MSAFELEEKTCCRLFFSHTSVFMSFRNSVGGTDGNFWDAQSESEGIDQSLGDAMVFSDSFLTDTDFSSVSGSDDTLEKDPQDPDPSSDYEVAKQLGVKAASAGAFAIAAPALMKYSSRLLNSSNEVEDLGNDSTVLASSFSNSATFSQSGNFSGVTHGAVFLQSEAT